MVVITQNVPAPHTILRTAFTAGAGSYSYSIPVWANYLDLIVLGGGGGGTDSDGSGGFPGGLGGSWTATTLPRASFPPGGVLTVTIGAGGSNSANNGGDSTFSATGMTTVDAAGGVGGGSGNQDGQSPGNEIYLGTTYTGGGAATTADGEAGFFPGGGAEGGGGTFTFGGRGADGAAWVVARAAKLTVHFDAVGGGLTGTGSSGGTFSHTAAAGAYVQVWVSVRTTASVSDVLYGGTAMTALDTVAYNGSSSNGSLYVYELNSVPGGTTTVEVDLSGATWFSANSVSYTNVSSVGTAQENWGQGTTGSLSATVGTGSMVVAGFGAETSVGAGTFSPSGGTNRTNLADLSGATYYGLLAISDASANTAFSTFVSDGSCNWAADGFALG